ncbi:hypothetical protein H8D29_03470 [PVC group bacterium]|nr:hypothetical protein [PVC group bacterium]
MGQFSWIAQDSEEQICSTRGHQQTVYMKDDRGNVWMEKNYDGYGVFGGKDFYTLLSEMNPDSTIDLIRSSSNANSDDDCHRSRGIDLWFKWCEETPQYKKINPIKTPCLFHSRSSQWYEGHPEDDSNQGWYQEPTCDWCGDGLSDGASEICERCEG